MFIDEFSFEKRTRLRETMDKDSHEEDHYASSQVHDGLGKLMFDSQLRDDPSLMPQVQIIGTHGKQNIKLKFKQNEALPGPKVCSMNNSSVSYQ